MIIDKLLKFADEFDMLPESGIVLACVSGGADSMAMLHALIAVSSQRGFSVAVAHYNHRLRGAESDADEAFVRDYCARHGIAFHAGSGDVKAYASEHGTGIEAAARDLRYAFFYNVAEASGALKIATAHTADDNAETVVMNLIRGTGQAGLSGIPPCRDMIIRPILRVSRDEVMRYIEAFRIPYVEDATNSLDIFTRNKIRLSVMPVLKEINPRFNEAVMVASTISRADETYLSELADGFIKDHCAAGRVPITELCKAPFAVSSRVIRQLHGGSLSYNHVKAVLKLGDEDRSNPSGSISLPGMVVYRDYGYLVFDNGTHVSDGFMPVYLEDGGCQTIPALCLKISCQSVVYDDKIGNVNKSFTSFLFKFDDLCGTIVVRPRAIGDTIKLSGGTKSLKKLFIERKVPRLSRSLTPVIADDAGVLAVYGVAAGQRAVPAYGDRVLEIVFSPA
ncbi:MAG: tRNA lysidine(34) synthetase TilS [Oscillospiraceae bacterium]|nr:tRNA lysidine(34) synthetase TilS [Oscillospiraceae bacterium]